MKNIIILIPVLCLTSCHINDARPENHRADVRVIGEEVCITLPDTKKENLSLISINEINNAHTVFEKKFTTENSPNIYPNQCLSNYGFRFQPGKKYTYSVDATQVTEGGAIKNGNSYSVTFSVLVDKGKLMVKDLN